MPVRCQECNAHFILDGTTVVNGISCPDCNGTKLERDQPSPTHSDGELRDMVDPATQLDQGGNPLQEGVWAGVDGGWQPAHKRDETLSKVANPRGPFDMYDGSYDLPSGGEGHNWNCPNCGGQMDTGRNECFRCGYSYGRDGGKLIPDYRMDLTNIPNLGPIHQGSIDNLRSKDMFKHDSRSLSMEPYLPWAHQAQVKRYEGDERSPITLTTEEWHRRQAFLPAIPVGAGALAMMGGRMLLRGAIGGLMRRAINGAGNFLDSAGQAEGQPGTRGVGMVASERTAVGVNAPVETPGSVPDMVEDHDPEAVDQQEFNDRDMNPAFNNPNNDASDGGLSQSTGEDGMKQKLEFREDGPGVNQAEMLLPLIMEYVHSDKSALENPQLKALHDQLEAEIPDYINLADEEDERVHQFLEALRKPHGVEAKTAEHIGLPYPADPAIITQPGTMRGAEGIPLSNHSEFANRRFEELMAQGVEPKAAWQMAAREADQVHGRGAYASVKEAAPVYQNTPMNPNQMMMGPQQMAMPGTHQNPVGPGGMSVTGKCVACGGVTNADGSCPQCGAGAGVNQQGNLAHPGGTAGQQTTPLGIMPSPYAKTAGDEYDNWYAQQGLPEGGSASMVRECPNCHGHNMQYQAPSGPDLHLDLEQGTLNGHPPLDDTPRNTPGPLHNPDATDDMGHFACPDCGYKLNGEGAESDNLVHHNMREQDWGAHLPIRQGADHQGPITPQQKEVFAEFLIDQGRNDEVAAMMGNPGLYADEWAQYLNRSTQPPEVDPAEQAPVPQMDPSQMGQMPMPGMTAPPPGQGQMMAKVAGMGPEWHGFQHPQNPGLVYDHNVGDFVAKHSLSELYDATEPVDPPPIPGPNGQLMRYQWDQHGKGSYGRTAESSRRCPKCTSATTSIMNADGDMRCHRCGNVWDMDVVEDHPTIKSNWQIKRAFQDNLNDAPNPVAAPAADVQAPGDREQQADSTLTWQSSDGQPLQVGQVYEMHNPNYPIPDVIKVQAVKPDAITVTMEGEYNAPSDPQDANGPGYTHEIDRSELETQGLFFNPVQVDGSEEQSQDQTQQDGIGQTVNTEPVEQPHDSFPVHTHVEQPTDHCPKCSYNHVTSSYTSPETIRYECYRCANTWEIEDKDPGTEAGVDLSWLKEDDSPGGDIGFDPRALAMASNGKSRNIQDIARDPRAAAMRQKADAAKAERLRLAGAKFSPSEQKQFIDEDGVARNSDLLNLEGTHYVSAFDNSKARPDRVNDNYLGLGL